MRASPVRVSTPADESHHSFPVDNQASHRNEHDTATLATDNTINVMAAPSSRRKQRAPVRSYALPDHMHRKFTLDTGCDHTLCHSDVNRFLHNAKQSYARIYGFAGTTTIDGDEHGTLHAYVMSSQPGVPGTNLQYDVHTVPTLNSDLMSMEHWYANLNYDFHLVHDGFSGLELKDKDGSITHRIPVKRDPHERRWYLDIIIAHNADSAKAAGKHLQRFPPATMASLTKAEEQAVSNSNTQILEQLTKHQSDTRAITIRADAAHNLIEVLDSEIGGICDQYTADNLFVPEQPFFQPTCFNEYSEFDIIAAPIQLEPKPEITDEPEPESSHEKRENVNTVDTIQLEPKPEITDEPEPESSHEQERENVNTVVPYTGTNSEPPDQSHAQLQNIETVSTEIDSGENYDTDPVIGGVRQGMPSRERRLNSLEFHRRSAHIGHHDKCETCMKLRKTLRRVYKQVDPYKDHRIGYAFAMDGITWSDQSRQGNKYTIVLRDIGDSGYLIGFHLAYKSDATDAIENTIIKFRNDPRFQDTQREQGHKLISEIHTDPAGEWRNDNAEFQAMCARIGVIIKYSSPDDKRSASHAENAVRLVERGTKSIMMETTCPVNFVEYACDQYITLHNCFPMKKDLKSGDGDAPRPLEKLSSGRVSRRQCDHTIHHSIPVGTPCLVTIPHVRGSDITNIARCRWAIAIKQYEDLPIFLCPHTGHEIRSKGYVAFHLKQGQNAYTFMGLESPKLPKAQNRLPLLEDTLQHFIMLDINTPVAELQPVIDTMEDHTEIAPQVITTDMQGRVYEPDHNGSLVPTNRQHRHPALMPPTTDSSTLHDYSLMDRITTDNLTLDPDSFIGADVYKFFYGNGVDHGLITHTECHPDGKIVWGVVYDDGYEQTFDHQDMLDYVINHIHGDHIIPETEARMRFDIALPETQNVDNYDGEHITTTNNDTFFDVCRKAGIPQTKIRQYYQWLQTHFNYGHLHDQDKDGVYFKYPFSGKKIAKRPSRFDAGVNFPVPRGNAWDVIEAYHAERSNLSNPQFIQARQAKLLHNAYIHAATIYQRVDNDVILAELKFKQLLHQELTQGVEVIWANSAVTSQSWIDKHPDLAKYITHNEYIDPHTGRIKEPTSVRDAKTRSDWPMWEQALKAEFDGLDKLGVFEHDLTLRQLRERGIHQSAVPQKLVFKMKYDGDGKVDKPKARNCIAGHRGVMRKGEHYFQTFAATPREDTARLLAAITVYKGYQRVAFDINSAFCQAECKDYEKIPLRYPPGMERKSDKGEPLFALLQRNLYGSPSAPRRFMQTRNTWMLEYFNKDGWQCYKMRYDPCLFKFISPSGAWSFLLVHVDDCLITTSNMEDAAVITAAFAAKFTITMIDPDYLLGVEQKQYTKDGVNYIEMKQTEYIETLVSQYADEIKAHVSGRKYRTGIIEDPVPSTTFFSVAGDPDKGIPPTDETEIAQTLKRGYQSIVGALNWPSRHCYPDISAGIHQLCRLLSAPNSQAYEAALQMVAYLDGQKDRGILFSNNATPSPICYYDSSDKKDPKDSKAQHGHVIFMCGGPILWTSKKHNHTGRSSTDNEYMAQGHACTSVMWVRSLLYEMGFPELVEQPTPMLGDNDQATKLAIDDHMSTATRYFRLEYHFCKEAFEDGSTQPLRVAGSENYADMLTKCLPGTTIRHLRPGLTGYQPHPELPKPSPD